MPLSPDDIVTYPLKQAVRGYAVKQVDELLDEVADELERLNAELEEAERRARAAETRAEELAETETALKRTLVTAHRAAEETLEEAERRAEEMLEEAREESDRILRESKAAAEDTRTARELELINIEQRIEHLRARERVYREDLRRMIQRHAEELEQLDKEAIAAQEGLDEDLRSSEFATTSLSDEDRPD